MSGNHPTFTPQDFTLVEDPHHGKIVSALNLISQTWNYAGIPFGVGRVELVGTAPEYRRRGLVRIQMDTVHRWSLERGELAQAITGIPYYYRQFGYEMALSLSGGRIGYPANVPELPSGEAEPYTVRPALEADLPFIAGLYDEDCSRWLVSCRRTVGLLRYELSGRLPLDINRKELGIITGAEGEAVGFVAYPVSLWTNSIALEEYHLLPGVSWLEVTPCIMRFLWRKGQEYAQVAEKGCTSLFFSLGESHPVYPVFAHRLPRVSLPYAFYLRVPDLTTFLRAIAPVLEKRLAEGIRPGYSGELRIGFYRSGLLLVFDQGHLLEIRRLGADELETVTAGFPGLTFLQILFGYHTLEELRSAFPDCWVNEDKARPILEAIFPKQSSSVWPVS